MNNHKFNIWNFSLFDLGNYICKTYVIEIEKSFSLYGLISFSGKAIKDKAVSLIFSQNKLKFNVEIDILKKKRLSSELKKLNKKNSNCYFKRQYFKFSNIMDPKI